MSAAVKLNDIASLAAPPFRHGLDEGLRLMSLDLLQRLPVQFHPEHEILDGADASVDHCDFAVLGQSVDSRNHAVRDGAEALLPTAYKLRCVGHSVPPGCHASWCDTAQNVAPILGSTPKVHIPWDVFARPLQNSHAPTRVTSTTRPHGHPSQQTPTPPTQTAELGLFHSVSRSTPKQSANSGEATNPSGPHVSPLTLLRPS